jgi:hypothetical protein
MSDVGYIRRCKLPGCTSQGEIAGNRHTPFGLAMDEPNGLLYWLEGSSTDGAVLRCPLNGCGTSPPEVFAVTAAPPRSVAAFLGNVYYTSGTDGQDDGQVAFWFYPAGVTTVLARRRHAPSFIVTDGRDVYWSEPGTGNDGQVVGCPADFGGSCDTTLHVLAGGLPNPTALALSPDAVYWVNRGDVNASNGSVMSALR